MSIKPEPLFCEPVLCNLIECLKSNLRMLRLAKGLTQEQVSEIALISRSAYSRIESGKRNPDIPTLCLLADYYGIGLDVLLSTELKSLLRMN